MVRRRSALATGGRHAAHRQRSESRLARALEVAAHLLLPVLALVMLQAGSLTRYFRASMLDVIRMDYIRTARQGFQGENGDPQTRCAMRCCRSSPCWGSSCRDCSPAR